MDSMDIYRRLASLEDERKAPRNEVLCTKLKCASAVTKGNVYILTATAQLIEEVADEEGNIGRCVIALESKTDSVGNGQVWAKCAVTGEVWVNFESGLSPTILDYVITSSEEGLAKTVSEAEEGSFGQLLRWDGSNDRGLVLIASFFGDISSKYPIGARITSVNDGGATYDCVEVNSNGGDISPQVSHEGINNIGGAILEENMKVPLFLCNDDGVFFLARRIKQFVIRGYVDDVLRAEWTPSFRLWDRFAQEFQSGQPSSTPNGFMSHIGGTWLSGSGFTAECELYDVAETDGQCYFYWSISEEGESDGGGSNTSLLLPDTENLFDHMNIDISSLDVTFTNKFEVTFTQKITRTGGSEQVRSIASLGIPAKVTPETNFLALETQIYAHPSIPQKNYFLMLIRQCINGSFYTRGTQFLKYYDIADSHEEDIKWVIERV